MKKYFSRVLIFTVAAILVLLCGCAEKENAYPDHTDKLYINDFAGVMEEKDADEILGLGAALEKATRKSLKTKVGAQVAAVTVESTGDEEISDYALAIGRKWGLGDEKTDNGVVILLATDDREIYVAVGYGLEGALPDSKTGRIIDNYAIDYFKENEFSAGMVNLYRAIVREVYSEYDLETPESVALPQEYGNEINEKDAIISWVVILIVVVIWLLIPRRRVFSTGFFPFFGGFGGGRGGGGGFGGSGGFGGFSGGGGGFGGGGAGRGF
ncbi:MAG: TPM domain-containing protein [Clostridia bacterium]|nr:TPM domain-containing protein [Clostridia bacterium]